MLLEGAKLSNILRQPFPRGLGLAPLGYGIFGLEVLELFEEVFAHGVDELTALLVLVLKPLHLCSDLNEHVVFHCLLALIGGTKPCMHGKDAVQHSRGER